MFSRAAAEQQMKLYDAGTSKTILGRIYEAVDPTTGTKFALENIRAHSDEFMYSRYAATLIIEPGALTPRR